MAGRTNVRVRPSVAGSGSATIAANASIALGDVGIRKPLPPGANPIGTVSLTNNGPTARNLYDTTNVDQVGGAALTLGQKASAASMPVVLPSDQNVSANNAQVGGTAIATGVGASNPGTQRVAVATDSGLATATGQNQNVAFVGATGSASALAANGGTFTGATRDSGAASGAPGAYAYFNAYAYTDQAGSLFIDGSNDGTTWVPASTAAAGVLAANTPLTLSVPVLFRFYRARVVNSSTTAQTTLTVNSSFTAG